MASKKPPMKMPMVDLDTPQRTRVAAQNIHRVFNEAPDSVRDSGRNWYHNVNEATAKGLRGSDLTIHQGAGLVAAVSPNMDWENHNIAALGELRSLNRSQFAQVAQGDRSPLHGMSISRAPQGGLLKAQRIMHGDEDPYDVLDRRSAPKTNSFAHNIAEPDVAGHVTIDGRAHDIAANRLQPWMGDRGIGSAGLKSGKPTRYEHFENAYRAAAGSIEKEHGLGLMAHQVQAVTWETGKAQERSGVTKTGTPRKQGVARHGQSYSGL